MKASFFVRVALAFGALICAGVAFSQSVPPTVAGDTDLVDLVFKSASAGAAALVAWLLSVVTAKFNTWTGIHFDAKSTAEAFQWEQYLDSAFGRAEAYARTKVDVAKNRSGYINAVVTFLHTYNRDILLWADKNGNGIIDLLEPRLPAVPGVPPGPQGFMDPAGMAPKLARKPKAPATVMQ
jgi:hypothetical protein